MAELTPKTQEAIRKQWSPLRRKREQEFTRVLASARKKLPRDAQSPLLPFIVRDLWEKDRLVERSEPLQEIENLETKLNDWWKGHEWMQKVEVVGPMTTPDLEPLARMLLAVRQTQRKVDETG